MGTREGELFPFFLPSSSSFLSKVFRGNKKKFRKKSKTTCLYLHSLFPLGHCQNQPYCLFSTASRKCLQMMLVRLLAWAVEEFPASAPCFCLTTDSSFSVFFVFVFFFEARVSGVFRCACVCAREVSRGQEAAGQRGEGQQRRRRAPGEEARRRKIKKTKREGGGGGGNSPVSPWSQSSIPSSSSPSAPPLISENRSIFLVFRSTARSCEYLHLNPFAHWPARKNSHTTDFGSTPGCSLGCLIATHANSDASSRACSSSSFFFCLRSSSAVGPALGPVWADFWSCWT